MNGQPQPVNPDQALAVPRPVKERKKHDRFNGMAEEDVIKKTLPDHITENLDIIIVSVVCLFYENLTKHFKVNG